MTSLSPNAFVSVHSDGTATAVVPTPEGGQGVRTVVAMMVAEELAMSLDDVLVEQAPGDANYGHQLVGNSMSVRQLHERIRHAAATARCLLIRAAATRWRVPDAECRACNGFVHHEQHGTLSYAGLVADASRLDPADVPVTLTPREKWQVLGGRAPRIDAQDIVTGKARYGMDVRQPGQLTAVVARPPWIGARPDTFDDSATREVNGVVSVVRVENGVAVVARNTAAALKGRDALRVEWSGGTPDASTEAWLEDLRAALPETEPPPGPVALDMTFEVPMVAHAPMEPMNATAHFTEYGLRVWAPTQDPAGIRMRLTDRFGPTTISPTLSGGAFGRRIEDDYVLEAVACARAIGAPVQVVWTREDDLRHDSYRPLSVHRLRAVVDGDGVPTWRSHAVATWGLSVFPGADNPELIMASGNHFPYAVAGKVGLAVRPAPVRTGFWRSVYAGPFGYAEECFLSALAARAGVDQVAMRRRLLPTDSRLRAVLDAAELAHGGRADGVACHADYGSAIAVIALAEGDHVVKITAAVDVGVALHPSGVRAQVEGAVMDALSTVHGARITVANGRVEQSSFRDYRWARMGDAPEIEVVIVESDAAIGGLGELAYPPAAAAIAYATSRSS